MIKPCEVLLVVAIIFLYHYKRNVFGNLSNIQDRAFCEKIEQLKSVKYFCRKTASEYVSVQCDAELLWIVLKGTLMQI